MREWIITEQCQAVAFESTGEYWVSLYEILQGYVEIIVANSYHIKWIPGKKTDTIDAEWIAELALNDLISPSRILSKEKRDLRALTRLREKLVNERTNHKNRVHKVRDFACIRLSAYFTTNLFGKSGLKILTNVSLAGVPSEEVVRKLPKRLHTKSDAILDAIQTQLSTSSVAPTPNFSYNDRHPDRQDQGSGTDNSQWDAKRPEKITDTHVSSWNRYDRGNDIIGRNRWGQRFLFPRINWQNG